MPAVPAHILPTIVISQFAATLASGGELSALLAARFATGFFLAARIP